MNMSDETIEIRPLQRGDEEAVIAFTETVPQSDLLFVTRDLRHPQVIRAWLDAIDGGDIHSQVALIDGEIAGYSALVLDPLSWSPHVGEIRILVGANQRRKSIGRHLAMAAREKGFELGLGKLIAKMTVDQKGAIALFEELGFRAEALLRDHVKTRSGEVYDLAILSHDVATSQAQRSMLGMGEG